MADGLFSFYGGPQGKSFEIKRVFDSVVGQNKNTLEQDLLNERNSQVGVGEFAMVSYGELIKNNQQSEDYQNNKQVDKTKFNATYHMTLWQKIYFSHVGNQNEVQLSHALLQHLKENAKKLLYINDNNGKKELSTIDLGPDITIINFPGGFAYILIGSMQGEIPQFSFVDENGKIKDEDLSYGYDILDANEPPYAIINNEDIFNPKVNIGLPQSQVLHLAKASVLDASENPKALLYTDGEKKILFDEITEQEASINNPVLELFLPQSEKLLLAKTEELKPNASPAVVLSKKGEISSEDGTLSSANNPVIQFSLPRASQVKTVDTKELTPSTLPSVTIDKDDNGDLDFVFSLPRAPQVSSYETIKLNPNDDAQFISSLDNNGDLKFIVSLPDKPEFYFGTAVYYNGENIVTNDIIPIEIQPGDYYINTKTSQIFYYLDNATFEYKGSFFQDAYETAYLENTFKDNEGTLQDIIFSVNSNTGETVFNFPRLPKITSSTELSPPIDNNISNYGKIIEAEKEYVDLETINYNFKIPVQGAFSIHAVVDRREVAYTEIPDDINNNYFEAEYSDLPPDKVLLVHYLLTTGEEIDYYYYRLDTNKWARSKITSQSTTGLVWGSFDEL